MNKKVAIVTGVTGQDGYYMAHKLIDEGYHVVGLSQDASKRQACQGEVWPEYLEMRNFDYTTRGLMTSLVRELEPSMIFNFAAKATGQGMFDEPAEMSRINGEFVLDILESIRLSGRGEDIFFCQASSSEMFGAVKATPQSEDSCFCPISPYGAAKLYAHNLLGIYRSVFGLNCASAILYNHESVRRSPAFVTKKIASFAARIKLGLEKELELGDISSKRDWGYAPEYVAAMYLIASHKKSSDYIVSSGRLTTVEELCKAAFEYLDLDYRDYVRSNKSDARKNASKNLHGNPRKIEVDLGWKAKKQPREIMIELVNFELERLSQN